MADLAIDANLGLLTPGVYNLAGDNTGQLNDCDYYSSASWLESGGEYVYEFSLAGWMTLGLSQNLAGGPDHDQFVLNDLTTTWDGIYNSATSMAFVDEDGGFGTFGAGTYYLSVDGYSGATGLFDMDLTATEYVPPDPPVATLVNLPYDGAHNIAATDGVLWFQFTIGDGTTCDFWTEAADPNPINDTEIGLYNSLGALVADNDDGGPGGGYYSGLMGQELAGGTYYLAVAGYDSSFYEGFDVTGGTATGDFMLHMTPEPSSLTLLALAGLALIRRR